MLLAIDIGNSNIVLGLYQSDNWKHIWRITTDATLDTAHYKKELISLLEREAISVRSINIVVLSSVVPVLGQLWEPLLEEVFVQAPIIVGPSTYPLLQLDIERPSEIGTDLVANAVAAHSSYKTGCIVVDFGTALTFTTVDPDGKILGVAIAPGLVTAMKALFGNTAQLPEVPLELPESVIGKNTIQAIQNGILWGYVGLVRQLISKTRTELGANYIAVATGGLSSILHPLRDDFQEIRPNLTLDGLRIIGTYAAQQQ